MTCLSEGARLPLFSSDEPDVDVHAYRVGVAHQSTHIHIFGAAFCSAELRCTRPDLFGYLGLCESFAPALIGKLKADAQYLRLLFIRMSNGWFFELSLIHI